MLDSAGKSQNGHQEEYAGTHGQSSQNSRVREVGERLGGNDNSDEKQRQGLGAGRIALEAWLSLWMHNYFIQAFSKVRES